MFHWSKLYCKCSSIIHLQNKYFYAQEDVGKQTLEEASSAGNRDATFVLAMLMLVDGKAMQQQALQSLNAAYPRSCPRTSDVQKTMRKVESILRRNGRRKLKFHICRFTCTQHRKCFVGNSFEMGDDWLFGCDVCLWEICFRKFVRFFIDDCVAQCYVVN